MHCKIKASNSFITVVWFCDSFSFSIFLFYSWSLNSPPKFKCLEPSWIWFKILQKIKIFKGNYILFQYLSVSRIWIKIFKNVYLQTFENVVFSTLSLMLIFFFCFVFVLFTQIFADYIVLNSAKTGDRFYFFFLFIYLVKI